MYTIFYVTISFVSFLKNVRLKLRNADISLIHANSVQFSWNFATPVRVLAVNFKYSSESLKKDYDIVVILAMSRRLELVIFL